MKKIDKIQSWRVNRTDKQEIKIGCVLRFALPRDIDV